MEQKLKMSTGRAVVGAVLGVILAAIGIGTVYFGLTHPETFDFGVDIFSFVLVIVLIIAVIVVLAKSIYDSVSRPLTFNNVNFTFKGRTYTYHQIEKIKIRGGRYGTVSFEVIVDGKRLYGFDDEYEGAKEFMYYLDFYKVPGTPRA